MAEMIAPPASSGIPAVTRHQPINGPSRVAFGVNGGLTS